MPAPWFDLAGPRRLVLFGLLAPVAPVAALAVSVGYVRIRAAGHRYHEAGVTAAPVALVLGAQVYPDGTPSSFLAARLDLARRLYASGRVRVLLVSGDGRAAVYDEPTAMRAYLIAAGVPAAAIVTDNHGLDTYDSCARAQRVFGVTACTVVTQSYHLPRAVATARALGLDANGVGDDSVRRRVAWWRGAARDQVACVKTLLDLLTRRDPVLGGHDPRVDAALRESG